MVASELLFQVQPADVSRAPQGLVFWAAVFTAAAQLIQNVKIEIYARSTVSYHMEYERNQMS